MVNSFNIRMIYELVMVFDKTDRSPSNVKN